MRRSPAEGEHDLPGALVLQFELHPAPLPVRQVGRDPPVSLQGELPEELGQLAVRDHLIEQGAGDLGVRRIQRRPDR